MSPQLLDFLETHSRIEKIRLFNGGTSDRDLQQWLLELATNSNQIKEFELYDERMIVKREDRNFVKALSKALALNRELASEAKIASASSAMFGLLADKANSGGAQPLPGVPPDITHELAKVIARHMPAAKAKAIFDELILHAPVRQ